MDNCEHCGKKLESLNPSIEDYTDNKFCFKLFGYKLLLVKDRIEYGCYDCLQDAEQDERSESVRKAVQYAIEKEIAQGSLQYQ